MQKLLMQCHMCRIGHVKHRWWQNPHGAGPTGHPDSRFKDKWKCDMKARHINTDNCEEAASVCTVWWSATKTVTKVAKGIRTKRTQQKRRQQKKAKQMKPPSEWSTTSTREIAISGLLSHSNHCRIHLTWQTIISQVRQTTTSIRNIICNNSLSELEKTPPTFTINTY